MSRRTHRVKLPKPKWRSVKHSWNRSQDFQYTWETPKLFSQEAPSCITWTYGIGPEPTVTAPEIPGLGGNCQRNPYESNRRIVRERMTLSEKIVDDYREGRANALEESTSEILNQLKTLNQKVQQMESLLHANSTAQSQPASPNENENDSEDSYV